MASVIKIKNLEQSKGFKNVNRKIGGFSGARVLGTQT